MLGEASSPFCILVVGLCENVYCISTPNLIQILVYNVVQELHVYLATFLTSPIEFPLYFQNSVRYLNENFREMRKIYETGLRGKFMRVNFSYKVPQTFEQSNPYFQKSQKSID